MAFTATANGLDTGTINGDWRGKAICRDDPEWWFPIGDGVLALAQADDAATQCREKCKVIEQCAAYIAEFPQEFGVWAGTTEQERRYSKRPYRPVSRSRQCTRCLDTFETDSLRVFAKICKPCGDAELAEIKRKRANRERRRTKVGAS